MSYASDLLLAAGVCKAHGQDDVWKRVNDIGHSYCPQVNSRKSAAIVSGSPNLLRGTTVAIFSWKRQGVVRRSGCSCRYSHIWRQSHDSFTMAEMMDAIHMKTETGGRGRLEMRPLALTSTRSRYLQATKPPAKHVNAPQVLQQLESCFPRHTRVRCRSYAPTRHDSVLISYAIPSNHSLAISTIPHMPCECIRPNSAHESWPYKCPTLVAHSWQARSAQRHPSLHPPTHRPRPY
jgi:hypothetical protein